MNYKDVIRHEQKKIAVVKIYFCWFDTPWVTDKIRVINCLKHNCKLNQSSEVMPSHLNQCFAYCSEIFNRKSIFGFKFSCLYELFQPVYILYRFVGWHASCQRSMSNVPKRFAYLAIVSWTPFLLLQVRLWNKFIQKIVSVFFIINHMIIVI